MPLSIYQGNDKIFSFSRKDSNGDVIYSFPEQIWFTVKKDYSNKGYVIQKTMDNGITGGFDGVWQIMIDAQDTAELPTGKYVCDVKILNEDGKQLTIVKPQEFHILDVATRTTNQGGV